MDSGGNMRLEGIEEYTQPDGLIVPKYEGKAPGIDQTGDGIKHFCMKHILKVRLGISRPEDFEEFERVIRSCYVYGYSGLLKRSPTKLEEQASKDVYAAVACASKHMKSKIAYDVLNRGNAGKFGLIKWFYPNKDPERFYTKNFGFKDLFTRSFWEQWMGKNPETITHIQFCSLPIDHRPHFLRVIHMGIYFLVVSTKHSGLSSMNWMMASTCYGEFTFLDLAIEYWEQRIFKRWPNGIKSILENELEPNHPIARDWV